jgi:hypothetical protein
VLLVVFSTDGQGSIRSKLPGTGMVELGSAGQQGCTLIRAWYIRDRLATPGVTLGLLWQENG